MSITYRAAYISNTVLTTPQQAHLNDDELRAEALAEAKRAGLINALASEDDEQPGMTADEFERRLTVGDWTER